MSLYTPKYQPTGDEVALIKTNKGAIKVRLAGKDAPGHVANFVELAEKGFYDGLKFHRHEPGFVIQGGCPNTRDLTPAEVAAGGKPGCPPPGTGGPGYTIRGEWLTNPHNSHEDGTLAMARAADPDSAGSQFYFCLGPQHFLDDNYTVFGQAEDASSLAVIHSLTRGDVIESIQIV
ncbi:MAG: peptidylprolyl isomerase [Actinomycetia bacterium]|nr:peptidylprolyl isomerase [Actinomycetes bacterium]